MMQQTNNLFVYLQFILSVYYIFNHFILLYNTCEFQSQLVDFRIPKSTDLITHFVIPKSTS